MSGIQNRQAIRRWYEEMWSLPNDQLAYEIVHPEYGPEWILIPKKGPELVRHEIRYFRAMFPDLQYELLDSAVEGEKVWAYTRGQGTHLGSGWGFEATGKTARFESMAIFTFDKQGLIIDYLAAFSMYDIFTDLGLVPPWWDVGKYLKDYPDG